MRKFPPNGRPPVRWRVLYVVLALAPIVAAVTLVQVTEPFPRGWLNIHNPHYLSNLLRAFAFGACGIVLGMIAYTMLLAVFTESTVTGGHPRRLLYRHIALIACGHGLLIATLLFYIRERINDPLTPATPLALAGLVLTFIALAFMLAYQNSRLRRFHAAQQIFGVVSLTDDRRLCVKPFGAEEPVSLDEWFEGYGDGDVVRVTIEKVEEA